LLANPSESFSGRVPIMAQQSAETFVADHFAKWRLFTLFRSSHASQRLIVEALVRP
jgi:hypothetical protein